MSSSGTRVGRFLLQETFGRVSLKCADANWMPGVMICSAVMVVMCGYFIWTSNVGTIRPLFGVGNQLLASVALAVGSTMLIFISSNLLIGWLRRIDALRAVA